MACLRVWKCASESILRGSLQGTAGVGAESYAPGRLWRKSHTCLGRSFGPIQNGKKVLLKNGERANCNQMGLKYPNIKFGPQIRILACKIITDLIDRILQMAPRHQNIPICTIIAHSEFLGSDAGCAVPFVVINTHFVPLTSARLPFSMTS